MVEEKQLVELGDGFEDAPAGTTRVVSHVTGEAPSNGFTPEQIQQSMDERVIQLNARGIKEPGVNAPLPEEEVAVNEIKGDEVKVADPVKAASDAEAAAARGVQVTSGKQPQKSAPTVPEAGQPVTVKAV